MACHGSRTVRRIRASRLASANAPFWLSTVLLIVIPIVAISQLWTVFRYRSLQQQVSQATGNQNVDSQWTFGQVAAVTIFAPVVVECWFAWLYE